MTKYQQLTYQLELLASKLGIATTEKEARAKNLSTYVTIERKFNNRFELIEVKYLSGYGENSPFDLEHHNYNFATMHEVLRVMNKFHRHLQRNAAI